MVGEDAVLLPRQNAASHRASQSTELLATTRLRSHLSISALHRLDMHQRFLRIYILTASAPDWLCCAVLCEMVTMDRSTAPSQFSILYSRGQACRLPKSPEHLECIRFGPLQWLRPSQVAAGREHTGRRAVRACVYATASPEDPHECRGRQVRCHSSLTAPKLAKTRSHQGRRAESWPRAPPRLKAPPGALLAGSVG